MNHTSLETVSDQELFNTLDFLAVIGRVGDELERQGATLGEFMDMLYDANIRYANEIELRLIQKRIVEVLS